MGRILLMLLLLTSFSAVCQYDIPPEEMFSQSIGRNIRKYRHQARLAHVRKDKERAKFLFDSLIKNVVNGKYIDNFKMKKFSGRRTELYKFEKPIYLITYASWCVPGKGEIPALNEVAETHHDEMDFVVLFWGRKKRIRKFKKQFGRNIKVLFIDERENRHDFAIRSMKHSLGFPTSFFINKDKQILDVRRNFMHHYDEDYSASYNANYQSFSNGVATIKQNQVITEEDQ